MSVLFIKDNMKEYVMMNAIFSLILYFLSSI